MADNNSVSQPGATSGEVAEGQATEYMTKAEVNAMINGFRKSLKDDLKKSFDDFRSSIPQPQEEPSTKKAPKTEVDTEKEAIKAELRSLREAREQDMAKARNLQLKEVLSETLVQNGVDQRHLKHAMAFLTQEGAVRFDDDGSIKMKVGLLDYDLQDAVKSWVKTEDAKLYLAPKGAIGSGQKGAVTPGSLPQQPQGKEVDWSKFAQNLFNK